MTQAASAPRESIDHFMSRVRGRVGDALRELAGDQSVIDVAELQLTPVPDANLGDVALPCFQLRGRLGSLDDKARNNPAAIAAALADAIDTGDESVLSQATAAGPYVNLRFATRPLALATFGQAVQQGDAFGRGTVDPSGETHVVIEFSAPNTNKPQHLGHVRNNVLGESVARILDHAGHRVTKVNLVNDRGIHICKSMLAYQLWGDGAAPTAQHKGDHLVGDYYVLFDQRFQAEYHAWLESDAGREALDGWLETEEGVKATRAWEAWQKAQNAPEESDDNDSKSKKKKKKARKAPPPASAFAKAFQDTYFNTVSPLGQQARQMLRDWEDGEPGVMALWTQLNDWVLAGFDKTYRRMGVSFDKTWFESETYTLGKDIIDRGLASGVFDRREDGAVVFDLERVGLNGQKVMLRSDGTSVYITQDLGTAMARRDELAFDKMIYVVADEQNYHFQVLFGALEALDTSLQNRFEHLSYGLVNLPHGRMKSREGTVVDADDLMDEQHRLARKEIGEKLGGEHYAGIGEPEIEHRAEVLGLAGLKYFLLDVNPRTTMLFDPEKSIDIQGRTGAYCLYNYARTRSLIRRAGGLPEYDPALLDALGTDEERRLMRTLLEWPDVLAWAARDRDPSKIAEYLFNLCKGFAFIFTDKENHPIATCEDPTLRSARLLMTEAVGITLRVGLRLLGIDVLEEM